VPVVAPVPLELVVVPVLELVAPPVPLDSATLEEQARVTRGRSRVERKNERIMGPRRSARVLGV
jgi:hypothetical protein